MKIRHNKKRNTAFLYEALIREMVKASIKNDKKRAKLIKDIILEYFNTNSILGKELLAYKAINEAKGMHPIDAEKVIHECKRVFANLDRKESFNVNSNLISKINKELGANVYSNHVPNYKFIASLNHIFNDSASISSKVLMERRILKKMTGVVEKKETKQKAVDELVIKSYTKSYNKKYNAMLPEQKEMVKFFINERLDTIEFKVFLNEQLDKIKKTVRDGLKLEEVKADSNMLENSMKVLNILESFRGKQEYTKEDFSTIMHMQDLAKEITS